MGPIDRREDSFRFLNGTPHIPALYACQPGLEILNRWASQAHSREIHAADGAVDGRRKARGWRVNTPEDPASAREQFPIDCPTQRSGRGLMARDILVDYRPKAGVRLSPHFYNRDEEIDFALEQMAEILASKAREHPRDARTGRGAAAN